MLGGGKKESPVALPWVYQIVPRVQIVGRIFLIFARRVFCRLPAVFGVSPKYIPFDERQMELKQVPAKSLADVGAASGDKPEP